MLRLENIEFRGLKIATRKSRYLEYMESRPGSPYKRKIHAVYAAQIVDHPEESQYAQVLSYTFEKNQYSAQRHHVHQIMNARTIDRQAELDKKEADQNMELLTAYVHSPFRPSTPVAADQTISKPTVQSLKLFFGEKKSRLSSGSPEKIRKPKSQARSRSAGRTDTAEERQDVSLALANQKSKKMFLEMPVPIHPPTKHKGAESELHNKDRTVRALSASAIDHTNKQLQTMLNLLPIVRSDQTLQRQMQRISFDEAALKVTKHVHSPPSSNASTASSEDNYSER